MALNNWKKKPKISAKETGIQIMSFHVRKGQQLPTQVQSTLIITEFLGSFKLPCNIGSAKQRKTGLGTSNCACDKRPLLQDSSLYREFTALLSISLNLGIHTKFFDILYTSSTHRWTHLSPWFTTRNKGLCRTYLAEGASFQRATEPPPSKYRLWGHQQA